MYTLVSGRDRDTQGQRKKERQDAQEVSTFLNASHSPLIVLALDNILALICREEMESNRKENIERNRRSEEKEKKNRKRERARAMERVGARERKVTAWLLFSRSLLCPSSFIRPLLCQS